MFKFLVIYPNGDIEVEQHNSSSSSVLIIPLAGTELIQRAGKEGRNYRHVFDDGKVKHKKLSEFPEEIKALLVLHDI